MRQDPRQALHRAALRHMDGLLVCGAIALMLLGLVMVASASIEYADEVYGSPWFFMLRHAIYLVAAMLAAYAVFLLPMQFWQRWGGVVLLASCVLLALVLVPGIGREVNGSRRWLNLGPFNMQPSELLKFAFIVYLAGFLVRRGAAVRRDIWALFGLALVLAFLLLMLLGEPDLGAAAVLLFTAFAMLFLGGAHLLPFVGSCLAFLAACAWLATASPYRLERLIAFKDPWADPYDSGYQLSQSLIAFGRGEWFGVGLGNSVQKHFYLPEAHTDFVFAIFAEEMGLTGVLLLVGLFTLLLSRMLAIGRRAEQAGELFSAYAAYGAATLFAMQAFINMGMASGLLPTKGLTLPFVSYGGSSLVVCCMLTALVLRTDYEHCCRDLRVNRRSWRQAA